MRLQRTMAVFSCLGAAALAVFAGGCGTSAPATLDPIARAAEVTTHAGGAQLAMSMQMSIDGKQATFDAHGDMDLTHEEGEVFVDLSGLGSLAEGKIPPGTTMTELLTHHTMYMSSSLLANELPSGAKWIKLDLGKAAQKLGLSPESLTSGQANPAEFLRYLKASSGGVRKVGTATVRGVPTTQYDATIDLSKSIAKLTGGNSSAASKLRSMMSTYGLSSLPVEVWIDSQHRLRRTQLQMSMSVSGHAVQTTVVEELFDFGPVPAVNAPSSSEVYEPSLPGLGG